MNSDWKEFLKEVHDQSKADIERSKQRETALYEDNGCDECKV